MVKSANLGKSFFLVVLVAIRLVRIDRRFFCVPSADLDKPLAVFPLIGFLRHQS